MNNYEMEQKTREVFSDEAFVKSLLDMETPQEVQAALKEKELDVTLEDIENLRDVLTKKLESNGDGELTEEDLSNVSGGFLLSATAGIILLCGMGIFDSLLIGTAGIINTFRIFESGSISLGGRGIPSPSGKRNGNRTQKGII